MPGEPGPVGPGPFDPDRINLAVFREPGKQLRVALARDRERSRPDKPMTFRVHSGRGMHPAVGVNPAGDTGLLLHLP
jgi:hypothetical protein